MAQKDTAASKTFEFNMVEQVPIGPGCDSLGDASRAQYRDCRQSYIFGHIAQNFSYPRKARKESIEARIYIKFVIERNGKVDYTEVVRGAEQLYADARKKKRKAARSLDEEALRVIRSLAFAEPAKQRGKPVRMSFTIPINARL
ncbi:MAG: energy transducer TonB [Owenweeksia sp.]|nr:energy transducer TonB [Owenweeksia sp.]